MAEHLVVSVGLAAVPPTTITTTTAKVVKDPASRLDEIDAAERDLTRQLEQLQMEKTMLLRQAHRFNFVAFLRANPHHVLLADWVDRHVTAISCMSVASIRGEQNNLLQNARFPCLLEVVFGTTGHRLCVTGANNLHPDELVWRLDPSFQASLSFHSVASPSSDIDTICYPAYPVLLAAAQQTPLAELLPVSRQGVHSPP